MDQGTLRSTVIDFLNNHSKAVFGILDEDRLPTTSLMHYVIDDELNVYFGTRKAFSKYGHVKLNKVVSLSVVEESPDPLRVVDVRGDVEEIPTDMLAKTHEFFKSKNSSKYYVEGADDFTMFKLVPHFVRYLDAESGELSIVDLELGK